MAELSGHAWLVLAAIAAWGVLGLLGVIAQSIKHGTNLHDLKVRVAELRRERLASREEPTMVEVEPAAIAA